MTKAARKPPEADTLYETDFYLWTQAQAELLRAGRLDELDLDNLIDEVASVGASEKHEIRDRLVVLITHLLKWEFQPAKRKYGWRATLIEQRVQIEGVIETSPSLRAWPDQVQARAYRLALLKAAGDTELPEGAFPPSCPYTSAQILDVGFYPGAPETDVV